MENEKWNPGLLLQTSGAYWKSCTIHAGVKLDLFTIIGDEKLTSIDIASKSSTDERGVNTLLNALVGLKLLEKENELYLNTPESKAFLSRDSEKNIIDMLMHHHHLVEGWGKLDKAVKEGKPVRQRTSFSDETVRESFLMGMFNIAMGTAPLIVPFVDLSGKKSLLDLGGGPGTYAIHFCMVNPNLSATIFDLPTTKPFAEKIINKFGLEEKVKFQSGDFILNEIKGKYDAIWLSHILHGEGPDDCQNIINKAVKSLEPNGKIIIHEFILNNEKESPEFPTLFSLNMLIGTENGRSYSENELSQMLKKAGVKDVKRVRMKVPNDSGLMIGNI
ncbi:MAG: SAM-dependent methyltransferase [Desulfobacterales bacterium]|nr:SAM-dependent methyltransferase [Desulfobacterales bacterium]MCP4160563.1 SAM-dependent methyltransferase [Deltaproteobacteria bacterium]